MRKVLYAIALAIPVAVVTQAPADSISPRAKRLHDRAIVVDSHADTTQRLIFDTAFDIGKRNPNGNIDIPRMREGGTPPLTEQNRPGGGNGLPSPPECLHECRGFRGTQEERRGIDEDVESCSHQRFDQKSARSRQF